MARMEEVRSAFKILTGAPIGKRPLGRPRHIWEENIRMDLKEIVINTRNWEQPDIHKNCSPVILKPHFVKVRASKGVLNPIFIKTHHLVKTGLRRHREVVHFQDHI